MLVRKHNRVVSALAHAYYAGFACWLAGTLLGSVGW